MNTHFELIEKIKNAPGHILILGESGSGKSTFAKLLHTQSNRSNAPFVHVDLGSLNPNLFESELFGHEKGSFTGALGKKIGFCEMAQNGTLFLDEFCEIDKFLQKKVLRLLDEKCFYSVGSTKQKKLSCQIILATNKDLKLMYEQNKIREDLYFRIRNIEITLPTLRSFDFKTKHNLIKEKFSKFDLAADVLSFLINYSWPGNYREVENAVNYLSIFKTHQFVTLDDLPSWLTEFSTKDQLLPFKYNFINDNYYKELERFEISFLRHVLLKNDGKINQTARIIGMSKNTLLAKIKKYHIDISLYTCKKNIS